MTTTDARERILLAAEQLVAERGPGVPLRDIGVAAGLRNNSAVQYYFGSRDGLIDAVVEHRMPALEAYRFELLAAHEAAGDADEPRVLVELLARPMLEAGPRFGATHFSRFLDQVRSHPAVHDAARLGNENRTSVRLILARLDRALGSIPDRTRQLRVRWMSTALLALLADYERAVEAGHVETTDRSYVDDLLDALVGILTAAPTRTPGWSTLPPSATQ